MAVVDDFRLIRAARRSAGLTQAELATRARTSQATLSAYETGTKSPSLKVLARLLAAVDAELTVRSRIDWRERKAPGLENFWVPSRLWRVPIPTCFDVVQMPDLVNRTPQITWDLRDRGDRAGLYEILIQQGTPSMMLRWLDGALLVELWHLLELPKPIRKAWQSRIDAANEGASRDAVRAMLSDGIEPLARIRRERFLPRPPEPEPPPPPPRRYSRFDPRPPEQRR